MKKYNKLCKLYRKMLNKCNKDFTYAPWDADFLLKYFYTGLVFMRDFYLLDDEVYRQDDSLKRLTTLKTATDAYEKYSELLTEYVKLTQDKEKNVKKEQALLKQLNNNWNFF